VKITRHWFERPTDPKPKQTVFAEGEAVINYFPDGHVEISIPIGRGPDSYVVTLTREEAERLQ
jgi:hypothetical protein